MSTASRLSKLNDIPLEKLEAARKLAKGPKQADDANALYQACLQMLKLGRLEAEVPRLVVFGQQSMGKTTLLDMIMGGPIGYSSTDTGTKQPVVIMLKPQSQQVDDADDYVCTLNKEQFRLHELPAKMHEIMHGTDEIKDAELELEIAIPQGVYATFVDLPGIKDDSKEGAEMTRNVVRDYVRNNPNDLYVLVKKASDDPANWPHQLKEFILSKKPRGLGLTPRQTVVVGTRAVDFLKGERNDIHLLSELQERILKRAVCGVDKAELPLHLLELFSLPRDLKLNGTIKERKEEMVAQIGRGWREIMELLSDFEADDVNVEQLENHFDPDHFTQELSKKFQRLLSEQLTTLERCLDDKRVQLQEERARLELEVVNTSSATLRESINLFVAKHSDACQDLVTGNFELLRVPEGSKWLKEHGGTVSDNLRDGHTLARKLFGAEYPTTTLQDLEVATTEALTKVYSQEWLRASNLPEIERKACPAVVDLLFPGQFVRYDHDGSMLFGWVTSMTTKSIKMIVEELKVNRENELHEAQLHPRFMDVKDAARLTPLFPVSMLLHSGESAAGFVAWHRPERRPHIVRPVYVVAMSDETSVLQWPYDQHSLHTSEQLINGHFLVKEITNKEVETFLNKGSLQEPPATEGAEAVEIQNVFVDSSLKIKKLRAPLSPLQAVVGEFAETHLLNQLSLTALGRWFKFHISHLEPEKKIEEAMLLQMMRSQRHVADQALWQPAVADLVQMNMSGRLMSVIRLAVCACSVALQRILLAGLNHMKHRSQKSATLKSVGSSLFFLDECQRALKEYCRERAVHCAKDLTDVVIDQSHALHMDNVINQIDVTRQFEADFLGIVSPSSPGQEMLQRTIRMLSERNQELQHLDLTKKDSGALVYNALRLHFWFVKVVLLAPMTAKLHVHFLKDVKDKDEHLGSSNSRTETDAITHHLLTHILTDPTAPTPRQRTDQELGTRFAITDDFATSGKDLAAAERALEYVLLTSNAILNLRSAISRGREVDFLQKLGA